MNGSHILLGTCWIAFGGVLFLIGGFWAALPFGLLGAYMLAKGFNDEA